MVREVAGLQGYKVTGLQGYRVNACKSILYQIADHSILFYREVAIQLTPTENECFP